MADDEESWEEPTKREPRERSVAVNDLMRFYRDLAELQLECGRLCVALERRDSIGIEFSASRLAAAWLVANSAIGLVEVPQIDASQRHVAELALRTCRHVVARLFALACQVSAAWETGAPRLHRVLRRFCDDLGFPVIDVELPPSGDRDVGPS